MRSRGSRFYRPWTRRALPRAPRRVLHCRRPTSIASRACPVQRSSLRARSIRCSCRTSTRPIRSGWCSTRGRCSAASSRASRSQAGSCASTGAWHAMAEKTIVELRGGFKPAPVPPGLVPAPVAPFQYSQEPPKGLWTQAGSYGRQFKGVIPSTAGVIIPVFSNDQLDGFPRARCVHLYRSDNELLHSGGGNNGFRLKCTYGQGGVQNQFFADWQSGGNFSLPCTTLRIEALSYAPNAESPYSTFAGDVVLGAMVGYEGMTTPRDPLTFTTERVELAAGESALAVVPDFARRVIPQIDLGNTTYADVEFALLNNGPRWEAGQFFAAIARDGVPITGGVTRVFLENNHATELMAVSFLFQLGL